MAARTTTAKAAPKAGTKPLIKAAAKIVAKAVAAKFARKGATAVAETKPPAVAAAKPAAPATVTLKHLSAGLAGRHGMEKKQADAVVTDLFETVVAHLKSGDRVPFRVAKDLKSTI